MRPRNKEMEIGPAMKFGKHFQAERLLDTLASRTNTFFKPEDVVNTT